MDKMARGAFCSLRIISNSCFLFPPLCHSLCPFPFFTRTSPPMQRQGFRTTGKASHVRKKNTVCLCPGGVDLPFPGTVPLSVTAGTKAAAGCGSLWYASSRELPRGFRSSVAFRCDSPETSARHGSAAETGDATGSVSFVMHNHRAALGGDDDGAGREEAAAMMPNSLCVRLEPDGEGGGQISVR